MKWPFVSRRVHEVTVEALQKENDELRTERGYWRARSELFIDRAAARAGITHEPVMRAMPEIPVEPFANNPFAGFGVSMIDSSRSDGKAAS